MRIEELTPGSALTFLVNINKEFMSFESTVQDVYPKKRLALADPIFYNQKIISFRGKNVIVDVLVKKGDEKPQIFKNVTVNTMRKVDNSLCYTLTTAAESKPYNRRQHFRCYVGVPSVVQFGQNSSAQDAIIRDVSASGFSITCSKEAEISPNQIVHTLFQDYIEELDESFSLHLYGLIVSSHKLENGKVVYGCRLNKHVSGLESYIAKKERVRLHKTSTLK